MPDDKKYAKIVYLQLISNGNIDIDRDYQWDGCDTPELDPDIKLKSVSVKKLVERTADLFLSCPDQEGVGALKNLVAHLKSSIEVAEKTIAEINTQLAK